MSGAGDARSRDARPATAGAAARWDARYSDGPDIVPPPAAVLARHERFLPDVTAGSRPRALDLACGRAGNGEWLAERGFEAHAWDVSEVVVGALRARRRSALADARVRDVLIEPPEAAAFDLIVVVRFLERAICPAIAAALRPGGRLFFQTFTHGPSNPAFLLGPNELPGLFPGLDVLAYREPAAAGGDRAEAMLVARRPL